MKVKLLEAVRVMSTNVLVVISVEFLPCAFCCDVDTYRPIAQEVGLQKWLRAKCQTEC